MISGVRALAGEFPDVIVSVGVGEVGQVANLKDVPARNSQGRVFPAAPPGCLPHLLQGPDDTTFHSPEPQNQYSSKDQICLATPWLRAPHATCCPVEHWVFSQLGSPSSCTGCLEGWGFQLVSQESPFSGTQPTHKKKKKAGYKNHTVSLKQQPLFGGIYSHALTMHVDKCVCKGLGLGHDF